MKKEPKAQKPYREKGDAIEGDRIFARCQDPGDWKLYTKSKQHRARQCVLKKDAFAIIEQPYTNIKN